MKDLVLDRRGEICNAGSRVLVHQKAYESFVEKLAERARKMVPGDPLDPATEMVTLMSAMRSYEANVAAMNTARLLALKTLDIGRGA